MAVSHELIFYIFIYFFFLHCTVQPTLGGFVIAIKLHQLFSMLMACNTLWDVIPLFSIAGKYSLEEIESITVKYADILQTEQTIIIVLYYNVQLSN